MAAILPLRLAFLSPLVWPTNIWACVLVGGPLLGSALGLYWQAVDKEAEQSLSWGSIHIHIWSKILFLLLIPMSFVFFLEDGFFLGVGAYYLLMLLFFYNEARQTSLGQLFHDSWSGWTLAKKEKEAKISLERMEEEFWAKETEAERLKERQNKSR